MKKVILIAIAIFGLAGFTSAQSEKHFVGEKFGGGVVFFVEADGLHGLIAETIDQGSSTWQQAFELVKKNENHSDEGKAFTDWRLPDRKEMKKMYLQKDIIGGFGYNSFWSSEELDEFTGWLYMFDGGGGWYNVEKSLIYYVRAVRTF